MRRAERLKQEYKAWDDAYSLIELDDTESADFLARSPAMPSFDLTPFQHRNANILNDAANFISASNAVFAHRLMSDDQAAYQLFSKTNRNDLGKTLDFLQDLATCITQLYHNGKPPNFGQSDLREQAKDIRGGTERVLRKLATS